MKSFEVVNTASGHSFGSFSANDADGAIDAMSRDAGYTGSDDPRLAELSGGDDLRAIEVCATCEDWIDLVGDRLTAGEFEDSVLGCGDESLPDHVVAVRRKEEEPTSEYWRFLAKQWEEASES